MIFLAVDTSLPRLAVSISEGANLLAGKLYPPDGTHMAHLLPAIDALLAEAAVNIKDIGAFAASTGPGSFTGIRIGVATIQQLAQVEAKPCLALNSLEAIALAHHQAETLVVPMLEARNRRIYAAAYYEGQQLIAPQVGAVDEFMASLAKAAPLHPRTLLFAGDETRTTYADDVTVRAALPIVPIAVADEYYAPEALALLADREYKAGRLLKPAQLLPEYYAPTQAERNFGVYL